MFDLDELSRWDEVLERLAQAGEPAEPPAPDDGEGEDA